MLRPYGWLVVYGNPYRISFIRGVKVETLTIRNWGDPKLIKFVPY
jgi:hypothetical protein